MNSKGQSLVLFVLVIPIIFLILLMVYNIGKMVLLKNELNDINYLAIDYGIDILSLDDAENKVYDMIVKNKSDIDNIDISIRDDKIYITLHDSIDIMGNLKIIKIKTSYVGYILDGKKVIEGNE